MFLSVRSSCRILSKIVYRYNRETYIKLHHLPVKKIVQMSEFNKGFAVFIDYFGYILLQSDFFFFVSENYYKSLWGRGRLIKKSTLTNYYILQVFTIPKRSEKKWKGSDFWTKNWGAVVVAKAVRDSNFRGGGKSKRHADCLSNYMSTVRLICCER